MPLFDEEKQKERLEEFREREAEDLAKMLADRYELSYIDLSKLSINTDALKLVPEEAARPAGLAAFHLTGKDLGIAIISPRNERVGPIVNNLKKEGYISTLYIASPKSLARAWARYGEVSQSAVAEAGLIDISPDFLEKFIAEQKTIADTRRLIHETVSGGGGKAVSKILELILAGAIAIGASDIHIEPEEKSVRLRMRLDGVLQDVSAAERRIYDLMLSRLKLVSGLKLNVRDRAQDGRFTIRVGDTDIEIRTSVTPGGYGESIVMRVLNPKSIGVPMEELGMEPYFFEIVNKEIARPNGMILVTGPTGSGKTTTLYAFLAKVNDPEIKIITIEDPIEYHLKGVSQTQVERQKGYDFHDGLLSALRHDPDIIMVGEIRDKETATTAINAALTGHLVFSTLHTNDAAGAIPRLVDLGVNYKILSSALSIVIAQRLVRKLCDDCKQKAVPTEKERGLIEATIAVIQQKRPEYKLDSDTLWKAGACGACNETGFRGRIGVYEALLVNEDAERLITDNPSSHELADLLEKQGMLTMSEDGILKALGGVTTLEEVSRVTEFAEDYPL